MKSCQTSKDFCNLKIIYSLWSFHRFCYCSYIYVRQEGERSNSPTYPHTGWLIGQHVGLNKATQRPWMSMRVPTKGNKETGNDQAVLVSLVVWNDPENTGRFDHNKTGLVHWWVEVVC